MKEKKLDNDKGDEDIDDTNLSIPPAGLGVPGVPQSLRRPAALLANAQFPQP